MSSLLIPKSDSSGYTLDQDQGVGSIPWEQSLSLEQRPVPSISNKVFAGEGQKKGGNERGKKERRKNK